MPSSTEVLAAVGFIGGVASLVLTGAANGAINVFRDYFNRRGGVKLAGEEDKRRHQLEHLKAILVEEQKRKDTGRHKIIERRDIYAKFEDDAHELFDALYRDGAKESDLYEVRDGLGAIQRAFSGVEVITKGRTLEKLLEEAYNSGLTKVLRVRIAAALLNFTNACRLEQGQEPLPMPSTNIDRPRRSSARKKAETAFKDQAGETRNIPEGEVDEDILYPPIMKRPAS